MLSEAGAQATGVLRDHVGLSDWRRRIAELHAEIRALDYPEFCLATAAGRRVLWRFGIGPSGVGRCAKRTREKRARCMVSCF